MASRSFAPVNFEEHLDINEGLIQHFEKSEGVFDLPVRTYLREIAKVVQLTTQEEEALSSQSRGNTSGMACRFWTSYSWATSG